MTKNQFIPTSVLCQSGTTLQNFYKIFKIREAYPMPTASVGFSTLKCESDRGFASGLCSALKYESVSAVRACVRTLKRESVSAV